MNKENSNMNNQVKISIFVDSQEKFDKVISGLRAKGWKVPEFSIFGFLVVCHTRSKAVTVVRNMNEWESKYHNDNFSFIFDFDKENEQISRLIRTRKIKNGINEKIFNFFRAAWSYLFSGNIAHNPA